jgi:DNA repair protein RecN (Recombination protein N)
MLETLKIKNLAIIDETEVEFKNGLNIISGETGAGKSIVIDAISLILGSRADMNLVRSGCDEAIVEGLFDIRKNSQLQNRLKNLGFSAACDQLLIKRTVSSSGKHRIYVNGEFATLTSLQNLTEGLVELCGQHEHQSLTKPNRQIEMLDRYGDLSDEVKKFEASFSEAKLVRQKKESLEQSEAQRSKQIDFLKFQLEELRKADLKENEDASLQDEKKLLQSSKNRIETAEAIRESLESEDSGALNSLRSAMNKLKALLQLDESTSSLKNDLENGLIAVEESSIAISRYLSSIQSDPNRLEQIQDRLALIASLKHKYGNSVQEMIETQAKLEDEFQLLDQSDETIKKLSEAYAKLKKELMSLGKKLSDRRSKAAEQLGKEVTKELKDLKMQDAKFYIDVQNINDFDEWSPTGGNKIEFAIQTNSGESAKPLGKIASGGELSRLMLSMRRVISDRGGIGVYLFDEIDAGIGGQTAFQVGKKLKSVAKHHQVICITHLPQVAAFADLHLVVQKQTSGKRTITEVKKLKSEKEIKEELARMLGGPKLTSKSLENAAELLELAI